MFWKLWQWLLSLLPDWMTEPIERQGTSGTHRPAGREGQEGNTPGDDTTGTDDTPQDITPDTLPEADIPNHRGSKAIPLPGTGNPPPEPVKEHPGQKPKKERPKVIIDLRPKRKKGQEEQRGR